MAWETRSKRQYYYRAKRVGNRVEKTYLGAGDVAQAAAAKDVATKTKRAADQAELVELQARLVGVDQLAAEAKRRGLALGGHAAGDGIPRTSRCMEASP